ncbi:MAG: hypothetical protein HKN11_18805 [Rhizobiales bacterium]|nr:hypothetical protein [Hyphomicrobiales bacterium]
MTQHGRGPDTIYAFKHALVQEAAYEILPKSRRVRLHHQIATALELLADESKDIRPETLAHHFFLAEEYYKACEHWWRAAIEARQNSADTEAVAFIHAALDANSRLPESNASRDREIELREDLYVPLQVTSWGSPEIAQNVERLRELRMQRGDREELLDILHALSGYNIISGRISAARKLAEEILDQYGQKDEVARVLGLRAMGMCSFLSGEPDEAIAEFKQIISLCDHIDLNRMRQFYQADTALIAHCMICWALALKGEREDMTAALAAVEPMIEACSDRWSSAYSLIVLASTHQTAGNVDQCLEFVYRGIPIAEECRSDYWIGWGEVLRGWAVARKGHVSQGSSEITQGLDRYCATGSKQMIPYAKTLLADALLASGQTVEVLEIIDELTFNREPEEVRFVDSMLKKLSRRAKARKKKDNARKA